jgi:hypothetical protein
LAAVVTVDAQTEKFLLIPLMLDPPFPLCHMASAKTHQKSNKTLKVLPLAKNPKIRGK